MVRDSQNKIIIQRPQNNWQVIIHWNFDCSAPYITRSNKQTLMDSNYSFENWLLWLDWLHCAPLASVTGFDTWAASQTPTQGEVLEKMANFPKMMGKKRGLRREDSKKGMESTLVRRCVNVLVWWQCPAVMLPTDGGGQSGRVSPCGQWLLPFFFLPFFGRDVLIFWWQWQVLRAFLGHVHFSDKLCLCSGLQPCVWPIPCPVDFVVVVSASSTLVS